MLDHKVKNTLNELIKNTHFNGVILVAVNKNVLFERCFGYADIDGKIPTSLQTQYLIGSVTKQFTAAALLQALYTQAKQNDFADNILQTTIKSALQNKISHYLPKEHEIWAGVMPEWVSTVTLHQLLVHSSGIPNYTSLPGFDNKQAQSAQSLVTFFKTYPLEFVPGTTFSYSNSNYCLLGIIIEELTKQPIDLYLHATFFEPLAMHSTYLPIQGTTPELKHDVKFKQLAKGYTFDIAAIHPEIKEIANYTSMEIAGAAGGMISNVSDLLKWNNALYSGKIIPSFLIELMLQPYIQSEKENEYYGYGIEIKNAKTIGNYYRHPGGIPGFKSRLTFIPRLQMTIVILENVYGNQESLIPEIEKIKLLLPTTLSAQEKAIQLDVILENKYPSIISNKKCYQLTTLEDAIIATVDNLNS